VVPARRSWRIKITKTYLPPLEEGEPYPLFVVPGLVPWQLFARALIGSPSSDDHSNVVLAVSESRVRVRLTDNLLNGGEYYVTVWLGDTLNVLHDGVGKCLGFLVNSAASGSGGSQGRVRVQAI